MAKSEDDLIVKIAGQLDPSLGSAVSKANKLISGASSAAGKVADVGVKVAGVAAKAVAATGGAIVTGAGAALKTAGDFDSAMSQVAASMGTTVDKIPDISAKAKEMGAKTSFSASEAAEGFNILAQAGLSANDQIAAIEPVLNLAAAGGIDMADAAADVTGAVMGFGDSMENAQKYADMVALGATQVKTDVGQLGEAFSDASAISKSFGQSQETTIVTLERFANANITGSEAAMGMRRVMTRLYAPTAAASKVLDQLGVSAYDQSGKARDLTEVIADLQKATDKLPESEKNAYLNTVLGQQGLSAYSAITATTTDKVNDLYKAMNSASDNGGAAAQQAATMLDNLQGDITIMKSALEGVGIAFGEVLTPYAREAVQWATDALSGITDIMNSDLSVTDKISKVAGEVGGLASDVITEVTSHLPDVITFAGQIISSFFQGIQQNWPQISQAAVETIQLFVTGLGNALPEITQVAFQMINTLLKALTKGDNAQKMVSAVANGISEMINVIIDNLPEFLSLGKQLFDQIIQGITQSGSGAGGVINKIFVGLLAAGPILKVGQKLGGAFQTIKDTIGPLAGLFGKFGNAASAVSAPAQAASSGLATLTANAKGLIALGAGFLMVSAGMALLVQSAINLAGAGPGAAVAMVLLSAAIAGMAIGAAALAPALAAGAVGLVAFGAGVALVGVGILAATGGIALLAAQLPTIATYGASAAGAILMISASLVGLAAGSAAAALGVAALILPMVGGAVTVAAFGVAMAGLGVIMTGAAVGLVAMVAQLVIMQTAMTSIANNATTAGTAIQNMVGGVDIVKEGLSAIGDLAKGALKKLASAFSGTAPDVVSSAQTMASGMVPPIKTATTQLVTLFTTMALSAKASANTIRTAFSNINVTVPAPKLPHISASYETVTSGNASTKVPKFSVKYFAKGGIVDGATTIGYNGNQRMVAGEKGPEAITPLSELWKQMSSMQQSSPTSINYAPQFIIQGNASRQDLVSVSQMSQAEFERRYNQMRQSQSRKRF